MKNILILDKKWLEKFPFEHGVKLTPMQYILLKDTDKESRNIINLSSKCDYQDEGYYVSLLAQARNQRILPELHVIQDLKDRTMRKIIGEDLLEKIQTRLKRIKDDKFELTVFLGKNIQEWFDEIAWEFFKLVKAPLFRVYFEKTQEWQIKKIKLLTVEDLWPTHFEYLISTVNSYFNKKKKIHSRSKKYKYDLAILVDSNEKSPPSDKKALKKFIEAGDEIGLKCELIEYKDRPNISEYDALFIRETTNVNHHTYKLARRAEKEGLVVIDDSESMIKCTNKVYLDELLDRLHVLRPRSIIINRENYKTQIPEFSFPWIVKRPDSAFSQGVLKADDHINYFAIVESEFRNSNLLLVQEFLPTDFDWRIGILNKEVIFVCKYFMAENHWQVINNKSDKTVDQGGYESLSPDQVDPRVLKIALKVARHIGNGLYGVDLKQKGQDIYMIEINDNPNIDHGVEDGIAGDELYLKIMQFFLDEINKKRRVYEPV